MKRSASALIRPLLRHELQIVGSVKPMRRLAQSSLIRKHVLGTRVLDSLLVGEQRASIRATRSLADLACALVSERENRTARSGAYHATCRIETLA